MSSWRRGPGLLLLGVLLACAGAPGPASVDVLARAAGVTEEEIAALNPQLLRGLAPGGRSIRIRVPAGRGEAFRAAFARIPPEERVTFLEHRIRAGETLSHLAVRYGVRVSELLGANPGIRPRRLRIGQWVAVPVVGGRRRAGAPAGARPPRSRR